MVEKIDFNKFKTSKNKAWLYYLIAQEMGRVIDCFSDFFKEAEKKMRDLIEEAKLYKDGDLESHIKSEILKSESVKEALEI